MCARRSGALGESEFQLGDVQERRQHNWRRGRSGRRWIRWWAQSCAAEAAESDRAPAANRIDSGIGVASTVGWSRYFNRGGVDPATVLYRLFGKASHVQGLAGSFQSAK